MMAGMMSAGLTELRPMAIADEYPVLVGCRTLLSFADSARYLGLARSRITAMVRKGIVPIYWGNGRQFIMVKDLDYWRYYGNHKAGAPKGNDNQNRHNRNLLEELSRKFC